MHTFAQIAVATYCTAATYITMSNNKINKGVDQLHAEQHFHFIKGRPGVL